jgi:hypothetical protein
LENGNPLALARPPMDAHLCPAVDGMKTPLCAVLALVALGGFSKAADLKPFEPKSMTDGYCYGGSRKDDKAIGGYGTSENAPDKVTSKTPESEGQISLVALPTESVPFKGEFRGFRLLLVNRSNTEAAFEACDSRLNIICEARDQNGDWKPIENLPSSFCGNSYHSVYLPGGHYWEFRVPVYSGAMRTKLRYQLQGKAPIYSNEFDGSVNPVQFKKPTVPK